MSEGAVTEENFRLAWSRFGTGVTIITTQEPDERVHGMTANSVISVSLSPPLALVSIDHERNSFPLVKANRRFGISILSADQQSIARHYTVPLAERGSDAEVPFVELGKSVVIEGALSALDCRVTAEHEAGDHTLFVAEVEHLRFGEGKPLLWYMGQFGTFLEQGETQG